MSPIPVRQVMNWTERGLAYDPALPLSEQCEVMMLDRNVDDRDIACGQWTTAMEMCKHVPCVCRGDT